MVTRSASEGLASAELCTLIYAACKLLALLAARDSLILDNCRTTELSAPKALEAN